MPYLDVSFMVYNAASKHPHWARRALTLGALVRRHKPDFTCEVEMYAAQRGRLTRAINNGRFKMRVSGINGGRVIRHNPKTWKPIGVARSVRVGAAKKRVVGRLFEHRKTGKRIAVVVPHLTWQHNRRQYRISETKEMKAWALKHWGEYRVYFAGDFNSPAGGIGRPDDSGPVMRSGKKKYWDITRTTKATRRYRLLRVFRGVTWRGKRIRSYILKGFDHPIHYIEERFKY